MSIVAPGVEFQNKIEMRNFSYEGAVGLNEETVKDSVGAFLRSQGYTVATGRRRERGADMRATKEGLKLIVEAKGEGSRSEMFNNFFLNVLGETLQRMSEPAAEYGVALPAHRKFVRLVDELSDNVRFTLRLNFYLVKPSGAGEYEVGFLSWKTR